MVPVNCIYYIYVLLLISFTAELAYSWPADLWTPQPLSYEFHTLLPTLPFSVHGYILSSAQEFTYTWDAYWATAKRSIVLKLLHLPSTDWRIESFSIVTLSLPRLLSTRQSVSQSSCMAVRHGPSIDVTSSPLKHFIFKVCRASSAGGRKYHTLCKLTGLK